jgi:hypothetical protein
MALAFRPCELLSSLFAHRLVRRPSINISHFNLLLRNHWANYNQTLVEWSLDGRQAKNRKKSSNFNCSYMARSSLTYVPGFSAKFFFQPIYTDYVN